ncbi:MAG: hypothetical protein J6S85_13410 [Methanobrevibacter sp.]|nr:hypothetical protein [Methanobrevibacter sp.]
MNTDDKRNMPFYELETVADTCHPLSKLVRLFYTEIGMTTGEWDRRYNEWCYRHGMYNSKQAESQRGNTRRQLQEDSITFKTFMKGICDIAGGTIRDMSVTIELKTPEGRKTIVVSLSDALDVTTGKIIPRKNGES